MIGMICMPIYIYIYKYGYISTCVCMCIYAINICKTCCINIWAYTYMFCIYVYDEICTYILFIYIYLYIYEYIQKCLSVFLVVSLLPSFPHGHSWSTL